jgi:glucose/mannose-6-phosphate isomerase
MEESILKYAEQFQYQPEIQNSDKLTGDYKNFILGGMGGSHLCAGLFHIFRPGINLYIHRDYGLPTYEDEFMSSSLFIASSYSGNTEEILDFAESSFAKGYSLAVITSGGKLLKFAQDNNLPYVLIPDTGIQPRSALGFSALAIASLVEPSFVSELQLLSETIDPEAFVQQAKDMSTNLNNKIPVIYSSNQNRALVYLWKITMNETGKIPAFFNLLPELNHNEMQGYDFNENTKNISDKFAFILLHDSEDHPKIELRMRTLEGLYQEKGFDVTSIHLEGDSVPEKVFNSIILANWIALNIAKNNGAEPEEVPLIEEFKRRIS